MKVKKLQAGGGFATFTPIITSVPQPVTSDTRSSSSEKEDSSGSPKTGSILNDMVYKELFNTGLSNDVNQLVSDLIKIESTSNNPYLSEANRDMSLRTIAKINEIKMNKESWKNAINTAQTTGGYGEVAVYRDNVFTKDENNNVKAISLANYAKNKDRIRVLTVADLMNEREKNPSLAGQNQLFNVANNSIGISKIKDEIEALVSKLGSDTVTSSKYISSLGDKPTQDEIEALGALKKVLQDPDNYAEITVKNTGQQRQIEKALKYVWNTLSDEKKQKLKVLAIMNNQSDPRQSILDILGAGESTNRQVSVTAHRVPGVSTSDGSGSAGKNTDRVSPIDLFHRDVLYKQGQTYEFNAGSVKLNMVATSNAPLPDLKSGAAISPTLVSNIMEQYKNIVDPNKAFIGDEKVDQTIFPQLGYTGEDAAKVYLPIDANGKPNLPRMEEFKQAYEIYNINKKSWTQKETLSYFKSKGFDVTIDRESNIVAQTGNVRPFLALPIITNSASDISANKWMTEPFGDKKEEMKEVLKSAFTTITGTQAKPVMKSNQPKDWTKFWWNAEEKHPYIGTLFIEYRQSAPAFLAAAQGNLKGPTVTTTDIYRDLNYSNLGNNPTSISASADVLNNE